MRMSVHEDDPGYAAFKAVPTGEVPVVFVDGVEVKTCFTADTDTGYALVAVRDDKGSLLINGMGDGVQTRVMHGVVTIELRPKE